MFMRPGLLVLIVLGSGLLGWLVGLSVPLAVALAAAVAFVLVVLTRPMPRGTGSADTTRQFDDARTMVFANTLLWSSLFFGWANGHGSRGTNMYGGGTDAGGFDPGGSGGDVGGFDGGGGGSE